jgi:hypothetical protein
MSTSALFVAKSMTALLITCLSSAVFLSFWGYLVQPVVPAGLYFLFFWMCFFCGTSIGFLVSICLRLDLAGMMGILLVLFFTLLSKPIVGSGPVQNVVAYFSFVSWGSIAFYTMSVAPYNATLTPWMFNAYGFSPSIETFAWTQMVCLGICIRLLAWLALVTKEL